MKKITRAVIACFMVFVIVALSVVGTFAASDPVQNKSYSYSETGDCTVDYGNQIYFSATYLITHRFTVNGKIATCAWADNSTPNKGTYKNATKQYGVGRRSFDEYVAAAR